MSTWATAWVFFAYGIAVVLRGAVILTTGKALRRLERNRMRPKPWAWSLILLGLCFLTEAIPVLAGGPPLVVAFVALIGALIVLASARLPRTS